MVIRNYHWLNVASWVLISTCSAPLVQTGEHKQFSLFDLWPMTLTYNPRLAKVKVDPQKSRFKVKWFKQESAYSKRTRTHTHGCYQTYYLPCYVVDNKENMNSTTPWLSVLLTITLANKTAKFLMMLCDEPVHSLAKVCLFQIVIDLQDIVQDKLSNVTKLVNEFYC